VRIGDDVVAQERLLREKFDISDIALVVGGSMGAQQAYEWAVRFPNKVKRAAPIAGTAQMKPHSTILPQTLIDTMTTDPAYADGWYERSSDMRVALQRHARIMALTGFSNDFWNSEFWRGMGFTSIDDFAVGFLEGYFAPMDAGDLVCQAWKWQQADVGRHAGGDLTAALRRITAKTFVMPIAGDQFFPVADCAGEQQHIADSELRVIDSVCGHLALFHMEPAFTEQIDNQLKELLDLKV
jgi:homoserine O-acetyltransferase